jgi:hypothetical protein
MFIKEGRRRGFLQHENDLSKETKPHLPAKDYNNI